MAICVELPAFVVRSTFTKGTDVFVLEYRGNLEAVLMYLGAHSQVLRFVDATAAAFFQADMERELLQQGWTFYVSEDDRSGRSDEATHRTPVVLM